MTDHRMVGSVQTCPFLGKFPLAQSIGQLLCFVQWLDGPDLGGGSLSLCLSAEALVHVAEATSIVAEARYPYQYIYTSECPIYWLSHGSIAFECSVINLSLLHEWRPTSRPSWGNLPREAGILCRSYLTGS